MRKAFHTVTVVGKIRSELLVNLPKLKQLFEICELSDGKTFWLKPVFSVVRTSICNDWYKFNLNLSSGVGGGNKNTPEMKEEAYSRNVKSSCSQLAVPLCALPPPHFWLKCTTIPLSILQEHSAALPQDILCALLWKYWVVHKKLVADYKGKWIP